MEQYQTNPLLDIDLTLTQLVTFITNLPLN